VEFNAFSNIFGEDPGTASSLRWTLALAFS